MTTVIHERVALLKQGQFEQGICRVKSGWVVLGDVQFLQGYSLIYPDPVAPDFNALSMDHRRDLMHDVGVLGDAILSVTGALRINYEILGNLAPALHVHVFPRFKDEPEELKTKPVWLYDWDQSPGFERDRDIVVMKQIYHALQSHPDNTVIETCPQID